MRGEKSHTAKSEKVSRGKESMTMGEKHEYVPEKRLNITKSTLAWYMACHSMLKASDNPATLDIRPMFK